ncbi:SPW repeat protein (plasmid) [Natrinema zhouii]|nr:SPW repeat protein [Natrinema zhouii]UHQ99271.1 SPW repeat protein [Natrinema zhouii]
MLTKLTAGGNGVLGCWLIAAPFVFGAPAVGRWNDVLVGTAIALVAGYNYARANRRRPVSANGAGFVTILGLWLVVAPFVLGLEGLSLWNDVICGTIMASFGSYNAYVASAAGRAPPFRVTAE